MTQKLMERKTMLYNVVPATLHDRGLVFHHLNNLPLFLLLYFPQHGMTCFPKEKPQTPPLMTLYYSSMF